LISIFLVLFFLSACGKVGDIHPPFIRIPEAVTDLSVTQSGYDLVLTWTNPPRYVDGSAATNLARVQIRSNSGIVSSVEVVGAGQAQSVAVPIGPMTPELRVYRVVIETAQGKLSELSNAASATPVEVPGRVANLSIIPDQRQIFLQWDKPKEHAELADAYVVTRSDVPAEPETVSDTRFDDTRYSAGKKVTYQVTAARRVSGSLIMGIGPETKTITIEDKTPPGIPAGLDIKPAEPGGYLTWDANPETDLAGYRVFRSDRPDSGFNPVMDRLITANGFLDPAYRSGSYYAVSAVDEFMNESPKSAPFRGP
jgi:uncharacterized protein